MRKQTKTLAVLSAAALFAAAAPMMTNTGIYKALAAQSGWTEEDGRFYYYDEDGYKETNTWKKRGGDWFYLDEDGEIAINQRVDDYFVNAEGHMAKNQWVSAENEIGYDSPDSPDNGSWLYFGKDGKIVTSKWMNIVGKNYYFDEDGMMQTGLLELDGHTYYLGDEDDGARKTGWILLETITKDTDDEDIWCYFDTEGRMVVNQMDRKIDNAYYTFIDGQMQTGWINVADAGFVSSSILSNEAAAEDSSANVASDASDSSANSSASASSIRLSDFRYYDPENGGRRASGWYTIEGAPGISEEEEPFSFFFKNGTFNERGEMQTGLQSLKQADGSFVSYYFGDDGVMRTGKQTIYNDDLEENQIWYFQTKGSLKGQGYHGERDNQVYVNGLLKKADPELRYEPVSVGEKRYLVNTSGTIQKASSSSSSSSRPELGKGFKDIKDSNDTIWTVDTSGIIQ